MAPLQPEQTAAAHAVLDCHGTLDLVEQPLLDCFARQCVGRQNRLTANVEVIADIVRRRVGWTPRTPKARLERARGG
jgi:hypothetical protein